MRTLSNVQQILEIKCSQTYFKCSQFGTFVRVHEFSIIKRFNSFFNLEYKMISFKRFNSFFNLEYKMILVTIEEKPDSEKQMENNMITDDGELPELTNLGTPELTNLGTIQFLI